jgi:hypothetical protein
VDVGNAGLVEDFAEEGAEVGFGGFRADAEALDGAGLGAGEDFAAAAMTARVLVPPPSMPRTVAEDSVME